MTSPVAAAPMDSLVPFMQTDTQELPQVRWTLPHDAVVGVPPAWREQHLPPWARTCPPETTPPPVESPAPVPEPTTVALVGSGLAALAARRRARRQS